MTFSLHQGGVVMSSQIKHTHSNQDTPIIPCLLLRLNGNGNPSELHIQNTSFLYRPDGLLL